MITSGGMSRRTLILTGAALSVVGSASRALAADKLKVGKSITSSFPFAGLELGAQQGLWKPEDIEIEISAFRGDGQMQQAMAAGSIDVGLGSGPGMGYAVKGVPGHAVAALAGEPKNMALVVTTNSPVKSADDLKGKRVGVSTAGSLTDWLARTLSTKKGWGSEGVEVIPMGEMRTRLAAMKAGELQASVTSTEEGLQLEEQGAGKVLMTFGDIVPDFHTHVIFAHDNLIQKRPEVLRRFLRGWFKTVRFMQNDRAATVKSIAKTMNVSEKVVEAAYDVEMGMMSFDGVFNPAAIEVIRTSLKDLGITETVPEAKALYVPGFVPVNV